MNKDVVLKIAREGSVIDSLKSSEALEALKSGRLLSTDYFLDTDSNTWKTVSELIQKLTTAEPPKTPAVSDRGRLSLVIYSIVVITFIYLVINRDSTTKRDLETTPTIISLENKAQNLRDAELKLQGLLPKFTSRTDKFTGSTWYSHVEAPAVYKRFLSYPGDGAMLGVEVNSVGGRYMTSYYHGESLNYDFVLFMVDGVSYGTLGASRDDKKLDFINRRRVEICSHLFDEDRKLLDILASAVRANKTITCRLKNFQYNEVYDWDPSPSELRVLADSVELADALRAVSTHR
jgi:hypothetical protein